MKLKTTHIPSASQQGTSSKCVRSSEDTHTMKAGEDDGSGDDGDSDDVRDGSK